MPIALAVSRLSPVHIITLIPAFLKALIDSIIYGFNGSIRAKIPHDVKSLSSYCSNLLL